MLYSQPVTIKHFHGPKFDNILKDPKMGARPIEDPEPTAWPYETGRLKEVDWESIKKSYKKKGKQWTDPDFQADRTSLFVNGKSHAKSDRYEAYKKWEGYEWKRAGDVFEGLEYSLYNEIEPEDVKQGNIRNCHLLATLSGMAERDFDNDQREGSHAGKTVSNMLLTKKINK